MISTINRLYDALHRLDSAAMQACYAPDGQFDDEVFSLRGRAQIGGMWRMLCESTKAQGRDVWRIEASQITANSAHWDAYYRFSTTGRLVHNSIEAHFEFNAKGLITRQRDRFSFWRWSRQALGTSGLLLGWTPIVRNKVRAQAAAKLAKFMLKPRG